MPSTSSPSRCSQGSDLDFYWFGWPEQGFETSIAAACRAFAEIMNPPARRWNPYAWAAARSEFKKRLELACQGVLIPVDEVKPIDRGRTEKLFEIRWSIPVQDVLENGSAWFHEVEVRAYHSEPVELPFGFVGLHVHEKQIVEDNIQATNDLQNTQIDLAIDRFIDGVPTRWGVI